VIDLDVPKPGDTIPDDYAARSELDGADVYASVCELAGDPLPHNTFTVGTPSGGRHLYYAAPTGSTFRNTSGTALGWKVDTRAHGGYVLGVGSVLDGKPYRATLSVTPMLLPDWLAAQLKPAQLPGPAAPIRLISNDGRDRYLAAAVRAEAMQVEKTRINRNTALYSAAVALGQLVAGGELDSQDVTATLLAAAAGHIANGAYSHRQAEATIASGLKAGRNRPRTITGAAA
jgi:hypothetical protein